MIHLAITGGSGFLADHLVRAFFPWVRSIKLLDIQAPVATSTSANVHFYPVDVRNEASLEHHLKGSECVIHAAAALPLYSKKDIFDVNVQGTRNVLEVSKKLGIPKVIYISSTAVYGVPKVYPILESYPLQGVGSYGESKIQAEYLCHRYRDEGLCVPIVRPKTFVGTGRLGVFQILFDWIKLGKRIPMIGNGSNFYQLLAVADLVHAIKILVVEKNESLSNDTFNIAAKSFQTVREDLSAVCEFAKTGAVPFALPASFVKSILRFFEKFNLCPLYQWVYETADHDSIVSIEKFSNRFKWTPTYSNVQALIHAYQWYLEHPSQDIKVGVTHTTAWNQGILNVFKKVL